MGFYVSAEGYNSTALLLTPEMMINVSPGSQCLSFWYFSYGYAAAATALRVYISREQVYSRPEWSRRQPPSGVWLRAVIGIGQRSTPHQVIFAADFTELLGGIALDDISIIDGICDFSM